MSTRFLLFILMLFSLLLGTATPRVQAQGAEDWDISGGRYYTQAAGGQGGFSVVDNGDARFWSEFQRLGGLQNVGYPISRRFVYDGFVTQAFQKLVLQWRPEVNQAWPVNVFDELSRRGFDNRLLQQRQTPFPLANFDPPGSAWPDVVARRHALLNANTAIRARYFSVGDPMSVFGLPVSRVEDMGNHYAVRTQRAVFQQWKENVPWAAAGQVTIANGGDIAKEMGWLTGTALQPEDARGTPAPAPSGGEITSVAITLGERPTVYALVRPTNAAPGGQFSLLISEDIGKSWRAFPGAVPFCANGIDLDPTTNVLYVSTCEGLVRWNGSQWVNLFNSPVHDTTIARGTGPRLWTALGSAGVRRSEDAGRSWEFEAGSGPSYRLAIDPIDTRTLYAASWSTHTEPVLLRGDSSGTWVQLPLPNRQALNHGSIVTDPQTGDLYVVSSHSSAPAALWRSPNPRANAGAVTWEKVHEFAPRTVVELHAGSRMSDRPLLFATFRLAAEPFTVENYRSFDGGLTWDRITLP